MPYSANLQANGTLLATIFQLCGYWSEQRWIVTFHAIITDINLNNITVYVLASHSFGIAFTSFIFSWKENMSVIFQYLLFRWEGSWRAFFWYLVFSWLFWPILRHVNFLRKPFLKSTYLLFGKMMFHPFSLPCATLKLYFWLPFHFAWGLSKYFWAT